jgi:hypothetical protein
VASLGPTGRLDNVSLRTARGLPGPETRRTRTSRKGCAAQLVGSCRRVPLPSADVSTHYFPRAAAHLKAAGLARERLHTSWSGLPDESLFDTGITTYSDGDGVIVAYAD